MSLGHIFFMFLGYIIYESMLLVESHMGTFDVLELLN